MIINSTIDRGSIFHPYVYWVDIFSDEELKLIIEYAENKKLTKGSVSGNQTIDEKVRS